MKSMYLTEKLVHVTGPSHLENGEKEAKPSSYAETLNPVPYPPSKWLHDLTLTLIPRFP